MGSNSSSVTATAASPEQTRLYELQEKLFSNDLILHEIIHQSLRCDTSALLARKQASILRLVCKEWLYQTNHYFRRYKKPFFVLQMFPSFPPQTEALATQRFAKFIKAVGDDKLLENHTPPFELTFIIDELLPEKIEFQLMQTFFSHKSSASVFLGKLTIYNILMWSSESIFTELPANFKLPHLQYLDIFDIRRGEQLPAGTVDKFKLFAQALLNSTVTLKKLIIRVVSQVTNDLADLMLPPSLIHLKASSQTILSLLTTSFNSQSPSPSSSTSSLMLPHLKELGWRYSSQPTQTAMSFQIGENFRVCMPKVEKLVVNMQENELMDVLCHPGWLNWPTIKTLAIDMSITSTINCMERIHRAFEALVHLELEWYFDFGLNRQYAGPLRRGLGLIFRKFTRLQSLRIVIWDLEYFEEFEWDSLIVGTTSERAKKLREDPSLWEDFLKDDNQTSSTEQGQGDNGDQLLQKNSIRELKQLKCLHLSGYCSYTPHAGVPYPARRPPPALMSMLAFRLGFTKLPQLDHVTLKYGFAFGMSEIECMKEFPGRTVQIIDYNFNNDDEDDD